MRVYSRLFLHGYITLWTFSTNNWYDTGRFYLYHKDQIGMLPLNISLPVNFEPYAAAGAVSNNIIDLVDFFCILWKSRYVVLD